MANPKQINANYRKTERLLEQNPTPVDLGVSETVADYIAEEISDLAKDDFSNVNYGSENEGKSLMVDSNGGIEVGNPSFTPGTSGVVVPDTPATIHDAVNQAYVESTVDGVNNLVHKSGNEVIEGTKTINGLFMVGAAGSVDFNIKSNASVLHEEVGTAPRIRYTDVNNIFVGSIECVIVSNGTSIIRIAVRNSDGTTKFVTLAQGDVITSQE